jgi:hypothetical protein
MASGEIIQTLRHLTHGQLLSRLRTLACKEREATSALVAHLAEMDRRGLHRDRGYPSLFAYCVGELRLSEAAAYNRITAARLARRFPAVLEHLRRGQIHLSALKVLGARLTGENHRELLAAASGRSKSELEKLIAERFPAAAVPTVVRKLPRPVATPSRAQPSLLSAPAAEPPTSRPAARPGPHSAPRSQSRLQPLSAEQYKMQLTASQQLHDKLETARRLSRHQVPDGDLATIVELALDLLIERRLKSHFGQTSRPRKSSGKVKSGSRHIPATVRRTVSARDGMRCTFVSDAEHRCEAREWLEFHHDEAFARGGPPNADNIRLLCQSHNQLTAERDFGPLFMEGKRTRAGAICQT